MSYFPRRDVVVPQFLDFFLNKKVPQQCKNNAKEAKPQLSCNFLLSIIFSMRQWKGFLMTIIKWVNEIASNCGHRFIFRSTDDEWTEKKSSRVSWPQKIVTQHQFVCLNLKERNKMPNTIALTSTPNLSRRIHSRD